jgi:peptidoglycan/xylan/chitin deacetylase (PgdA/CDA1 family)
MEIHRSAGHAGARRPSQHVPRTPSHPGSAVDGRRRQLLGASLGLSFLVPAAARADLPSVPILVYHRFAQTVRDSMTLRIETFEAHLRLIERMGCSVVPLSRWIAWRRGARQALPTRAIVLTADDGHRSQWEVMCPRLQERAWPVTLFVYPSAISNADYAMTWPQLRGLSAAGGVSVQSHTQWHPNFLQERKRMTSPAFQRFAADQLSHSRRVLQERLGTPVTSLAWPFGLSDDALRAQASEAGYEAGFSLGNRSATREAPLFEVPRHLMVDSVGERQLAARLEAAFSKGAGT